MARWATTIIIAGIDFSGCRGEIIGSPSFLTEQRGSIDHSADGTPSVQIINIGVKGIAFGIKMLSTDLTKVQSMSTAIKAAQDAHSTFVVNLVDEMININVNCVVDYSKQWIDYGRVAQGYAENVTALFVSKSLVI